MATQTLLMLFDRRSDAKAALTAVTEAGLAAASMTLLPDTSVEYSRGLADAYDAKADKAGFWSSLARLMIPDRERYSYAEGMSRGGVLLTAIVDDADRGNVLTTLEEFGAVDIREREKVWSAEGWPGFDPAIVGAAYDPTAWILEETDTLRATDVPYDICWDKGNGRRSCEGPDEI